MREKILFDDNWMFHKGDVENVLPKDKGPVYAQSKTEHMTWGPASRHYAGLPDNYETNENNDIKETEKIDPEQVKQNYLNAYKTMIECENKMKKLLEEGGYINE